MKRCSVFLSLILSCLCMMAQAQPFKEPSGPIYDATVKAYVTSFRTGELDALRSKIPEMEKAYPGHPYTLFFQAFYNHASGKDIPAALKSYSDAIRLMPDFSDPYPMRAGLFAEKGLFDRAVADMDKAIAIEGEKAGANWYSDRAEYKLEAGNAAEAFEDFKIALQKEPSNPKFYRGAMNTAFRMNQPEAAVPLFLAALNGPQRANAAIRISFANLLLRQQKFSEADQQFRESLGAAGYKADAKDYNSAGIAAMKLKDYDRSAKLLEQAIALDPKDADIICNRASVAIEQKAWEDVYMYAQKALAADAGSPLAHMMMAVGVKRTGRGDALAAEYEAKAKQLEAGSR